MSLSAPFAMHAQAEWMVRATDPDVDLWMRVAFLAYGSHRANGHAPFLSRDDIARAVQPLDRATGELGRMPAGEQVSRAIRKAREKGWLSDRSCAECLVVPPSAWGGIGDRNARCHKRHRG